MIDYGNVLDFWTRPLSRDRRMAQVRRVHGLVECADRLGGLLRYYDRDVRDDPGAIMQAFEALATGCATLRIASLRPPPILESETVGLT